MTIDSANVSFTGFGLSTQQFLGTLREADLRRLIDPNILPVLDAFFGGRIPEDELRQASLSLIDVSDLLADEQSRQFVVDLVPGVKRGELEERTGANLAEAKSWSTSQVNKARDFFGLIEQRVSGPPPASVSTTLPAYGLFDHQRSAVRRLEPLLWQNLKRVVLHLPTGVGKTRTAMHIVAESLRRHDPSVAVWLASGQELLEQAEASFREAWLHLGNRDIQVGTMWGNRTPDLEQFTDGFLVVGLAKGWSSLSGKNPDWALQLSQRTRLVVFDEAHQAIARTYSHITEDLTFDHRCSLLGLTATPGRTWSDIDKDGQLADFFGQNKVSLEVPSASPIEFLIDNGYLARPTFRTLFAEPGSCLNDLDKSAIAKSLDIPDEIIERLSLEEEYVAAVISAIEALLGAGHNRLLVFAGSVAQAQILTAVLAIRGTRSGVVTGETGDQIRRRTIANFKSRDSEPMVLFNYGVLTTGFDAPQASAVVIARPTKSLVLYSQMVGRAIRGPKAGGTETCEVVTVVDPELPGFGNVAEAFHNWEDVWA